MLLEVVATNDVGSRPALSGFPRSGRNDDDDVDALPDFAADVRRQTDADSKHGFH